MGFVELFFIYVDIYECFVWYICICSMYTSYIFNICNYIEKKKKNGKTKNEYRNKLVQIKIKIKKKREKNYRKLKIKMNIKCSTK